MNIHLLQGIEGAKKAKGIAVIIDVFRAFSLEVYLAVAGVKKILPVGAKETAYRLKEENPEFLLIGERQGKILPGFDFGNSPSQIDPDCVFGKIAVHTTSAGTQGVAAAFDGADEILTGSLVNAKAVAKYILSKDPDEVSLVCMGKNGTRETPEDTLCGEYIKALLEGRTIDMESGLLAIREHSEGKKFFDPALQDVFPQKDYEMCTEIDRFDLVLKVNRLESDVFETKFLICVK